MSPSLRMVFTAGLALLPVGAVAWGEEVTVEPMRESPAVLVRSAEMAGVYHALPLGGALSFAVTGPCELEVQLRQRLGQEDATPPAARLTASGDGTPFLDITVNHGPDMGGAVLDLTGGRPTLAETANVDLSLAGEHILTLEHVEGQLPVLVRVFLKDPETAPAPSTTPETAAAASAGRPQEPEGSSAPVAVSVTFDPPNAEAVAVPETAVEPELAGAVTPPEPPAADPSFDELLTPEAQPTAQTQPRALVGLRTGLGGGPAANKASGYLGVEVRVPLGERVGVGATLGHYGLRLEQSLPVQPALGGVDGGGSLASDWRTGVWPLELTARYERQLLGPSSAWASGGMALMLARRSSSAGAVAGAAVGTAWGLGVDLPLGPGVVSPSLSLNSGRRGFGNTAADDQEARERIGAARANLAYLFRF